MVLTIVVVAASVLLRLGTTVDAGGNASSLLPATVETAVRLAHRVSASAVGVLALAAAFVAWKSRSPGSGRLAAIVAILLLTAFLAVIGRYTTGYRFAWVTVGNVAGGMALACAFWSMRFDAGPHTDRRGVVLARFALLAVLANAALGAAAGAAAIHRELRLDPFHIALGPVAAAIAVAAAARNAPRQPRAAAIVAFIGVAQLVSGAFLAIAPTRSLVAGWPHALLAAALALSLVALAAPARRRAAPGF